MASAPLPLEHWQRAAAAPQPIPAARCSPKGVGATIVVMLERTSIWSHRAKPNAGAPSEAAPMTSEKADLCQVAA